MILEFLKAFKNISEFEMLIQKLARASGGMGMYKVKSSNGATLRSAAALDSPVVFTLAKGAQLELDGDNGGSVGTHHLPRRNKPFNEFWG